MDVSTTAQALSGLSTLTSSGLLALVVSVVLAFLMAPAVQAAIEGAIAAALPSWAFFAKPFLPSLVAGIVAKIAAMHGMPGVDAAAGAVALASAVHWVNEQHWAPSLEERWPKIWTLIASAVKKGGAAMLLIGLLGLGAGLKAEAVAGWCAGPALWAGSSLYQTNGSSLLEPKQAALGGVEFAGYLGSWEGSNFTPTYTLGLLGAMATTGTVNRPALGVTGGFYLQGVPMTVFWAKELTQDAGGSLWGIGTNVQFSGWVPFLYLGKPGN